MNRTLVRAAVVAGLAATVGGLVVAVTGMDLVGGAADSERLLQLLAIGGVLATAYLLYDATRSRSADDPAPWSDAGPIVETRPEAHPESEPLSGRHFEELLSTAVDTARQQRRIESGLEVVRAPVRETYLLAMEAGGVDRSAAERDLETGTWTDDPVAAAVLSPEVSLPSRGLRRRIVDWLFPGQAVHRMVHRTVDAVASAADDRIPAVVGQDAPRNVPVYQPSLASIQQGPGGEVRTPGQSPESAAAESDATEQSPDPERAPAERDDEVSTT